MKPVRRALMAGILICLMLSFLGAQESGTRAGPVMDIVFVLDTTGSMSGLIQTAKEKIWAIANEILRGSPTPRLRIGLVAYRDRKDAYVTRTFPLTRDLDLVHRNLMGFRAQGGGDTREHVNKALHDAVHAMEWTGEKGAVKIIFLVGDAPPHMDYDDGFDYRDAAREAIGRGIMVNTLRIGNIAGTEAVWREIARLSDGSYKMIKVTRPPSIARVKTRFDDKIEALRRKLVASAVGGSAPMDSKPGAAASPVLSVYCLRKSVARRPAEMCCSDTIAEIIAGRIKIEAVPESRLTPALKKLTGKDRIAKLKALVAERKTLLAEMKAVEKKRLAAVGKKMKERAKDAGLEKREDSFDRVVVDAVKKAAARAGVTYKEKKKEGDKK